MLWLDLYMRTQLLMVILWMLQDMDDENIIETVDFSEFEKLFQVKKATKKEARVKHELSEFQPARVNSATSNCHCRSTEIVR